MWGTLLCGIVLGMLFVVLILLFCVFGFSSPSLRSEVPYSEQYVPFNLPLELKQLLLSPSQSNQLHKKESCVGFNLVLQFLYQEWKDTKWFRKWVLKKLQIEFNDLLSRTAAGRVINDLKLRDFSLGSQFPVIKDVQISKAELSADSCSLEEVDLLLNIEYRGGLELSIAASLLLGQSALLSVRLAKLAGQVRLQFTRKPYTHWTVCFVKEPVMDFKVDSEFHGRPVPQLVPLIINQFKRATRKKHVFPQYKVRYRPFFQNPILQPSADPGDFSHVELKGALEVRLFHCSRLNVDAWKKEHTELYCALSLGPRPSTYGIVSSDFVSILLKLNRRSQDESLGIAFTRVFVPQKNAKHIQIATIAPKSLAQRAGFRVGDIPVAVNNVAIVSEKQAASLLSRIVGELSVIVERQLTEIDDPEAISDRLLRQPSIGANRYNVSVKADGFVHVDEPQVEEEDPLFPKAKKDFPIAGHRSLRILRSSSESDISKIMCSSEVSETKLTAETDIETEGDEIEEVVFRKVQSEACLKCTVIGEDENGNDQTDLLMVMPNDDRSEGRSTATLASESVDLGEEVNESMISSDHRPTSEQDDANCLEEFDVLMGEDNLPDICVVGGNSGSLQTTRKQRLKAKATHLAQRLQNNRRVRQFWDKRKDDLSAEELVSSVTELENANSSGDGWILRRRRHSQSAGVDKRASSESVGYSTEQLGKKIRMDDSSESSTHSGLSDEKRSRAVKAGIKVQFEEEYDFTLSRKSRYLNIGLWSRSGSSTNNTNNNGSAKKTDNSAPVLVAYTSLFVPEVVDNCMATLSSYHQETFALRPSSLPVIPQEHSQLLRHVGFDSRLCYGDVTLGFRWIPNLAERSKSLPDEKGGTRLPSAMDDADFEILRDPVQRPGNLSSPGDEHDWLTINLHGSHVCQVCKKKIWLKSAAQCGRCSSICHKKCASLARSISCVQRSQRGKSFSPELGCDAAESTAIGDIPPTADDAAPPADDTTSRMSADLDHRRRFYRGIADRLSDFRRRRRATDSGSDSLERDALKEHDLDPKSFHIDTNVMASHRDHTDKTGKLKPNDRRTSSLHSPSNPTADSSPFHGVLFEEGKSSGAYNEQIINAAKDLGRELLTDLPLDERKAKINEQVDKLQVEMDEAGRNRAQLLKEIRTSTGTQKEEAQAALNNLDDKTEALAVLMLHYCAGLQHCLDMAEQQETSTESSSLLGTNSSSVDPEDHDPDDSPTPASTSPMAKQHCDSAPELTIFTTALQQ